MCTVLQQHLAKSENGLIEDGATTPASSYYMQQRALSPGRPQTPGYSYLCDQPSLKRPIDPYDRKISTPAMHFHVPPNNPDGTRPTSRQQNAYTQQLYGRRSRSHSRTGMRVLVDQIKAATPRPKSPHMNNEEPINLSHYPDGRAPEENQDKAAPIERDDFPAPPFPYTEKRKKKKKRKVWAEPGKRMHFCKDTDTEESDHDDDSPYESSGSEIDPKEDDTQYTDLDKKENELRKISTGMGQVFLSEIAVERERRKSFKNRLINPRSAARTPAANREPHFKLRYDSPVYASPSRIADHIRPWDDDIDGRSGSRRSYMTTPFLPNTPLGRVVSPVNTPKPGYTQTAGKASTLPARFSPHYPDSDKHGYSTDFSSKSDFSDGEGRAPSSGRHSAHASTPKSRQDGAEDGLNQSLPDMMTEGSLGESGYSGDMLAVQAPNIYPLHLLYITNYRLPGDVDRANLERHMADKDFDNIFKMSRQEFYQMPYWKRCDLKRKANLF